jgi:hypothetical protein
VGRNSCFIAKDVRAAVIDLEFVKKTGLAAPLLIFLPLFAKVLHLVGIWACFEPCGIAKKKGR